MEGKMKTLKDKQVAVIGLGNVGKMLLEHLREMGVNAKRMAVYDTDPDRTRVAAETLGVRVLDLDRADSFSAYLWLLCTGPKAILPLIDRLAPRLKEGDVVVSFAAAVPMRSLEARLPKQVNVVRIMPNMPSLIGRGMNPVCFGKNLSPEAKGMVFELLEHLGHTLEVKDEQMNWCVGLSGAAMRSIFPAIEGLIKAGLEAGFSNEESRLIAAQVVTGAAELIKNTDLPIRELKALTPMETLDESQVEQIYYQAAAGAKEKIDRLQDKILSEDR
jgi:pyrroline-5-carboxylate reductase